MKKIKGDIITEIYSGNYDLVFHGCNCFNKIGAGLAGGDWDIIEKMIDRIFDGLDHTLVYL